MDPKEFDQRLVEKIKEEKLAPKPRWHFLLKNYVVWASGALSLLVGAAAVSVMAYLLKYSGWELREETHKSVWEFLLLNLPFFWIIFLGFFVFVLYYNLKHTKKGYRYPVWVIATAGVGASIVLGGIFYVFGLGQRIDNVLGEKAPFYEVVMNRQLAFWFNPDEGRLAGVVASEAVGENFYLVDPTGELWLIIGRNEGRGLPGEFLRVGEPVNIIGTQISDKQFRAEMVRPLVPGRGFFKRPNLRDGHQRCQDNSCPLPLQPGS